MGVMAVVNLCLAFFNVALVLVVAGCALYGLAEGALLPTLQDQAVELSPPDHRGAVGADPLDTHHLRFPEIAPQLYNLDAVAYESVLLGLFSINQGPPNQECDRLKIH